MKWRYEKSRDFSTKVSEFTGLSDPKFPLWEIYSGKIFIYKSTRRDVEGHSPKHSLCKTKNICKYLWVDGMSIIQHYKEWDSSVHNDEKWSPIKHIKPKINGCGTTIYNLILFLYVQLMIQINRNTIFLVVLCRGVRVALSECIVNGEFWIYKCLVFFTKLLIMIICFILKQNSKKIMTIEH